jgi:hypothetical protein
MERDDGTLDWDAAFEALVAGLRPPRYQQVARVAWQTLVAVTVMVVTAWLLVRLVAAPISDFGRPWR